jgi:hypothetical protein
MSEDVPSKGPWSKDETAAIAMWNNRERARLGEKRNSTVPI